MGQVTLQISHIFDISIVKNIPCFICAERFCFMEGQVARIYAKLKSKLPAAPALGDAIFAW